MNFPFTVFIPYDGNPKVRDSVNSLRSSKLIEEIYLIATESIEVPKSSQAIRAESILSTKTLKSILSETDSEFIILILKPSEILFGRFSLNRFLEIANLTGAGWLFSDYFEIRQNRTLPHPQIDYQSGSVRDDFDFGEAVVIRKSAVKEFFATKPPDLIYAGLYSLRLFIARHYSIVRIPEFLYSVKREGDNRPEEKQL